MDKCKEDSTLTVILIMGLSVLMAMKASGAFYIWDTFAGIILLLVLRGKSSIIPAIPYSGMLALSCVYIVGIFGDYLMLSYLSLTGVDSFFYELENNPWVPKSFLFLRPRDIVWVVCWLLLFLSHMIIYHDDRKSVMKVITRYSLLYTMFAYVIAVALYSRIADIVKVLDI